MADLLVVKAKIKDVISDHNVAGDFAEALNAIAVNTVKAAAARADANGRKTVQAKDVMSGKMKSEPMLVVKSKVKEVVSGHNVAGDFAEALNTMLIWFVEQAAARADANGRRTVMAKDL
jgi:histone H3/H4